MPIGELPLERRNKINFPEVEAVYFIHSPDLKLTKVGRTTNLNNRYRKLQSQIPCSIDLVNWIPTKETRILEKALHKILRKSEVKSEWFNLSEEQSEFVLSLSIEDFGDILSIAESIGGENIMKSISKTVRFDEELVEKIIAATESLGKRRQPDFSDLARYGLRLVLAAIGVPYSQPSLREADYHSARRTSEVPELEELIAELYIEAKEREEKSDEKPAD